MPGNAEMVAVISTSWLKAEVSQPQGRLPTTSAEGLRGPVGACSRASSAHPERDMHNVHCNALHITPLRSRNADTCMQACVECGATKTPLWRCNVDGVKSLCNR